MSKIAFAILGFSLMLNFATGAMFHILPQFYEYPELQGQYGYYNSSGASTYLDSMQEEIRPSGGALEDKGSSVWRVLDMINIGFIAKLGTFIEDYLFGFVKLIGSIVKPMLDTDTYTFLFSKPLGMIYALMSLVYTTSLIMLWTNRDITGKG